MSTLVRGYNPGHVTFINDLTAQNMGGLINVSDGLLVDARVCLYTQTPASPPDIPASDTYWRHCFHKHKEAYEPGSYAAWKLSPNQDPEDCICATQGAWTVVYAIKAVGNEVNTAGAQYTVTGADFAIRLYYWYDELNGRVMYQQDLIVDGAAAQTSSIGDLPAATR